jgi:uncharacterized protein with PIN domain/sulfur carrier protein ThiS
MKSVLIRFYEELNDFLPKARQKKTFLCEFTGNPSIKDLIESVGVPHSEIDLILVNGKSVNFNYSVQDGDKISVYPVFESLDISEVQHLRAMPLRNTKFVVDVQLGVLAKYLRMLGFDALFKNNFSFEELIKFSLDERRTILTKNGELLKRKEIIQGYFVRNNLPKNQIKEILSRFDLVKNIKEFTRCLVCNSLLETINKNEIEYLLPPKVKESKNEFWICKTCNKIYWKGTHYLNMEKMIENVLSL